MKTNLESPSGARSSDSAGGPPLIWWFAHAIAGAVLGGSALLWGLLILANGRVSLPITFRTRLVLEGTPAELFGWAMIAACIGLVSHAFLACFDRIKWPARALARAAGAVVLMLFIAALVTNLAG